MQEKLKELKRLTDLFHWNISQYLSQNYDEANLRVDFIDKFFELLGWDVRNTKGYSETYRDVVREDKIIILGKPKAPDYSFRIGGHRKFFVEAKRPSVNIKEDAESSYQIRRYGYTAKLPLCILTDFEEFAIYDTRIKPNQKDNSSIGRVFYCKYDEYEKHFEFIFNTFSVEGINKGSFEKYINENKKKGTSEVDKEFLKLIEGWRNDLAKSIAKNNLKLEIEPLNFAVQKIINRIIFLRIAEDRHIEEYETLKNLTKRKNIYKNFSELCIKADAKYNSQLFYTEEYLRKISIDDDILVEIILGLYFPECPYEFSVMEVEILGNIYEQFLGKIIRLTAGHNAKVEEKPEVRKAGGVYYTPQYIVDYIVENTVGEKIKSDGMERDPKEVESLTILDPACGSGSFLLGAYSYLINYHLRYYTNENNIKQALKDGKIYQSSENNFKLSIEVKRKILLNNIYGVDIDSQAVEVSKLSLLLKLMENENQESVGSLFKYSDLKLLPDLRNNIKCGNSLIGTDFYQTQDLGLFENKDMKKVNAFDWEKEFPSIFKNGGFDVVIGNPPYIRIQSLQDSAPFDVEYYKKHYKSARKGNYDIYVVFVEKGLRLISKNGLLGFIIPSKFFATDYGENLRNIISEKKALKRIVDFGHLQIFEQATTYTCLLFLSSLPLEVFNHTKVNESKSLINTEFQKIQSNLSSQPWVFSDKKSTTLLEKILYDSKQLCDLPCCIGRGSSSGADSIFILQNNGKYYMSREGQNINIESEILRIPIYATDFGRYKFHPLKNEVIIFPYEVNDESYRLLTETEFDRKYPQAYNYLSEKKKELKKRKQFKEWYSFSAPRNLDIHDKAQILVPLLANKGLYCRLSENSSQYCLMASGGFSITVAKECELSPNYVLGLLNSKLLYWRLRSISNTFRGGWITCTKQYVETLPIRNINSKNLVEVTIHDQIVSHVNLILNFNKEVNSAKHKHEKELLKKKIDIIDTQIDRLVYELYGLTEEEIKVVEGK